MYPQCGFKAPNVQRTQIGLHGLQIDLLSLVMKSSMRWIEHVAYILGLVMKEHKEFCSVYFKKKFRRSTHILKDNIKSNINGRVF
jgi:hypothetical protein